MPLPNTMSFTPFDPLTAAEMNDMVENDEALQDWSAFDAGTLPASLLSSGATAGPFLEIGKTSLTPAGDTITVSSLPARKYLQIFIHLIPTGGTIRGALRLNGDTGNNYANRFADNSATDTAATSASAIQLDTAAGAWTSFYTVEVVNVSANEKLVIAHSNEQNTAGAGIAPARNQVVAKWVNTSVQINSVTILNTGTGDYAIGSEVVVMGKN